MTHKKDSSDLEEMKYAPHLSAKEVDLLMKLYPFSPIYMNVRKNEIMEVNNKLKENGYSIALLVRRNRRELCGRWILEVRKYD